MAINFNTRAPCFISPVLLLSPRLAMHPRRRMLKAIPRARLQIEILTIGKRSGKDAAYDSPIAEYRKRMSRIVAVSERTVKPTAAFATISEVANRGRASVFLLDEHGDLPRDSIHFSKMLFDAFEQGDSRLSIVIGDAEGLPQDIIGLKGPKVRLLSLSPLTFTHNMVSYPTLTDYGRNQSC